MQTNDTSNQSNLRYEVDDRPPVSLCLGQGLLAVLLVFPSVALAPAIVARAAGQDSGYLSWAVFAALLVCGLVTILQAFRFGRFGAGHVLVSGGATPAIAVCILALSHGGVALVMNLVIVCALAQLILSARLSWLRRIMTPVVSGVVLMLIAVAVMPVAFEMLTFETEGAPPAAAPVSAAITLLVFAGLEFGARGRLRLWAPLIGIVAGCAAAAFFGLYNTALLLEAPWISTPASSRPAFGLSLGAEFWLLLPAFLFVTLANAVDNMSNAIAVQEVSRRGPHSVDFRAVQGASAASGLGNLVAGFIGTLPVKSDAGGVSFVELGGIAARRFGVCIGVILLLLAFAPKLTALFLAIPGPVVAAYLAVIMALLFVQGIRMVVQDGFDYRKASVVGLAFLLGAGFQNQAVFEGAWGLLLGNSMTVGGLAVILFTLIMKLTGPKRYSIITALDSRVLHRIKSFLRGQAGRMGWGEAALDRLDLIGEEMLLSLSEGHDEAATGELRTLLVTATNEGPVMVLEFAAAIGEGNIEDRMRLLGDHARAQDGHEISLRLLQHFASSVQHQQYHGMDVVTVRVEEQHEAGESQDR